MYSQKDLLRIEIGCLMENCDPRFQSLLALLSLETQISMKLSPKCTFFSYFYSHFTS